MVGGQQHTFLMKQYYLIVWNLPDIESKKGYSMIAGEIEQWEDFNIDELRKLFYKDVNEDVHYAPYKDLKPDQIEKLKLIAIYFFDSPSIRADFLYSLDTPSKEETYILFNK